jgi:hypothetical protein
LQDGGEGGHLCWRSSENVVFWTLGR